MALLRKLCSCCCPLPEDLKPLRTSHSQGISSSDAPIHSRTRSSAEIAAEAARTQEWCLQNLETMKEPPPDSSAPPPQKRKNKRNKSEQKDAAIELEMVPPAESNNNNGDNNAWAPPDEEVDVESSIAESVPKFVSTPTRKLVDAARRSHGLPPLLAAAQIAAERAPTEASALLNAGCVEWLRDVLNQPEAIASPAATHRLCFALHALIENVPPHSSKELQRALLDGKDRRQGQGTLSLPRVLCTALKRHTRVAPLVEEACYCIAGIGERGGKPAASALLTAGCVDSVLEVMAASVSLLEVQAAGAAAIGALLDPGDGASESSSEGDNGVSMARRQIAENILNAGGVLSLASIVQEHPDRDSCIDNSLRGLVRLIDGFAPTFESIWPTVEQLRERGQNIKALALGAASGRAATAQQRAAKHAGKKSVPLLCAALLLKGDGGGARDHLAVSRGAMLLRLLSACARLGAAIPSSKLLPMCEKAMAGAVSSGMATSAIRQERGAARAACELWALIPAASEQQASTLRALLTASTALAAASGVERERIEMEAAGTSSSHTTTPLSEQADGDHAAWCAALLTNGLTSGGRGAAGGGERPIEALMQSALRNGRCTSTHSLPASLKAVTACLDSLPPARAAEAAAVLCTGHGLLVTIHSGLGMATLVEEDGMCDKEAARIAVRSVAAALRGLALLLRAGGTCRTKALALPVLKKQGELSHLLKHSRELRTTASVQAAGCSLLRALSTAGIDVGTDGVDALVAALNAFGELDASVAREACEAVGTLAANRSLLKKTLANNAMLVGGLTRALAAHGTAEREVARAACNALRLICGESKEAKAAFDKEDGRRLVKEAQAAHGAALRKETEGLA